METQTVFFGILFFSGAAVALVLLLKTSAFFARYRSEVERQSVLHLASLDEISSKLTNIEAWFKSSSDESNELNENVRSIQSTLKSHDSKLDEIEKILQVLASKIEKGQETNDKKA